MQATNDAITRLAGTFAEILSECARRGEQEPEPYLLTKEAAAERYSISQRQLANLYRRYTDFPVVRIGSSVLIVRERADRWFADWIGNKIDI